MEVRTQIYSDLASAGYVNLDDVNDLLAESLNLAPGQSTDARLNTIIRTNTFEAVNEARYNYFTDPLLQGYVEALEYSAILDSRTTNICRHLDGQVHASNSETWKNYRPPNHYNCRSLLVPVTTADKWTEDPEPTMEPQKGFA